MQEGRDDQARRRWWMGVLAKAEPLLLERAVARLGTLPDYGYLRPPEPGSVMVQARAGGTGAPFTWPALLSY